MYDTFIERIGFCFRHFCFDDMFVVGATLGAIAALMGALFGLKSNRGLLHGAAAGAIAGAYFYLEFFKASVGLWNSFANGPVSFLHLVSLSIPNHCCNATFLVHYNSLHPAMFKCLKDVHSMCPSSNEYVLISDITLLLLLLPVVALISWVKSGNQKHFTL